MTILAGRKLMPPPRGAPRQAGQQDQAAEGRDVLTGRHHAASSDESRAKSAGRAASSLRSVSAVGFQSAAPSLRKVASPTPARAANPFLDSAPVSGDEVYRLVNHGGMFVL